MKMLLSASLLLLSLNAKSQDIITKLNGDQIHGKVIEVGISEVKYKKSTDSDAAIYIISKSEIFMIGYEDGTTDVINKASSSSQSDNKKLSETDLPKSPRFMNITEGGIYIASTVAGGFSTAFGAQANDYLSVGAGFGYDIYQGGVKYIPVYFDCRASFLTKKVSPFIGLDAGYSFDITKGDEGLGKGAMYHLMGGAKIYMSKDVFYLISIGYRRQLISLFDIGIGQFAIKTGFQF